MTTATNDKSRLRFPRSRTEPEKAGAHQVYGYAKVAGLIAKDPEKTGGIYRRFDKLAARNLLYLEANLAFLEAEQTRYDEDDSQERQYDKSLDLRTSAQSYEYFRQHAKDPKFAAGPAREALEKRMRLVKDIRKAMKEYQEALSLYSAIINLPKPHKHTIKACRTWLERDGISDLKGASEYRLQDKNDLCALRCSDIRDPLSSFSMDRFQPLFTTQTTGTNILFTSSKRLAVFVSVLLTAPAFDLLFGAIEALHGQKNHSTQLGILAGFVLAFAVWVGLFTGAKGTAPYAAALVVYVSGPGSDNGSSSGSA